MDIAPAEGLGRRGCSDGLDVVAVGPQAGDEAVDMGAHSPGGVTDDHENPHDGTRVAASVDVRRSGRRRAIVGSITRATPRILTRASAATPTPTPRLDPSEVPMPCRDSHVAPARRASPAAPDPPRQGPARRR